MYTRPTTPLAIGGVIDDAIKLYRGSFRSCWVLSLIGSAAIVGAGVYLLTQMLGIAGGLGVAQGVAPDPKAMMPMMLGIFSSMLKIYIVLGLISLLVYAALFAQMSNIARGGAPQSLAELLGLALRRLPGLIVASIIFGVGTWIGFVLLFIPGVYLWGKLELWFVAVFADDVGAIEALGRSWTVTAGNWWRSVTIISVALIMIFVLELLVSVVSGVLIGVPLGISHMQDIKIWTFVVPEIVRAVVSIFVLPMIPAALLATYNDLKLRREGGDLAVRVNSLQSA
jgi:hypothetical protein